MKPIYFDIEKQNFYVDDENFKVAGEEDYEEDDPIEDDDTYKKDYSVLPRKVFL